MKIARGDRTIRRLRRVPGDEAGIILLATASKPMTPRQLSEMLDIPIVQTYRKIRLLESLGLLNRAGTLYRENGKSVTLYSSQMKDAKLFYSKNKLQLALKIPGMRARKNRYQTQE